MAPAFKSERPLTRSQYAKRRDQTTKEELAKLKSTPEFKTFAKTKGILQVENTLNTKQLSLSAIFAIVVTIVLASTLPGKVSPNDITSFVQPTTADRPVESYEVQPPTNTVDLEYSVIELTSHLKSTETELYETQKENKDLVKALEFERNQALHTSCPAPVLTTSEANASDTFRNNLQWIILGPIGLIVSVIASIFITKRRISSEITTLRSENLDLVSQLKELAFEKDMSEQSISILESELQRKMSQLAEAQSQYKKPATPVQSSGPENETGSPRIRAIQNQKAAVLPTHVSPLSKGTVGIAANASLAHNGMQHPHRTPDSLPPPPRQLVERFLEERGAIAIEEEQVHAWLEMESLFGQLQREVTRLRADVEGRDGESEEQKRRIEELNQALAEQKKAAKMAKDALKAVRSVGNGK